MTDRFPLIVDIADGNKIKELPSGDNLNLQNSSIVNADSLQVGVVDANTITQNGNSFATVAITGSFNDLSDKPVPFDKDYNSLSNLPIIPNSTRQLNDIEDVEATEGQVLVKNSLSGRYEPRDISGEFDLTNYGISALNDVVLTGNLTNKYLKNTQGAWRASLITWGEIQNRPLKNSRFTNDSGYLNPTTLDAYITTDTTITYQNGAISVSSNSITTDQLDVASTGAIGDSLQSTGDGSFVWRNNYVEQTTEPLNPLPGDEWLETENNIYYKYMGGHWIPIVQYDVIETESGTEINTESGDAIDFG